MSKPVSKLTMLGLALFLSVPLSNAQSEIDTTSGASSADWLPDSSFNKKAGGGEGINALKTTADNGEQFHDSDFSRQGGGGVEHHNDPYDRSTPLNNTNDPDTLTTRTKDYLKESAGRDNSRGLKDATTRLLSNLTVNPLPFPSGKFNLGFPTKSGLGFGPVGVSNLIPILPKPYTGPYTGPFSAFSHFGGLLPPTATSSVDLSITDGLGGFNLQNSAQVQAFQAFANRSGFDNPEDAIQAWNIDHSAFGDFFKNYFSNNPNEAPGGVLDDEQRSQQASSGF